MRLLMVCAVLVISNLMAATDARAQVPQCVMGTIAPLAFGQYNPFAAGPRDFTTSVTVTCTRTSGTGHTNKAAIRIDLSAGSFGTIPQRKMGASANRIDYNLFKDSARTIIWGTGTGSPSGLTDTITMGGSVGTPTSRTYTIFGRLPAGQSGAAVASYLDQIIANLFAVFS